MSGSEEFPMADEAARSRLGRGLAALMGDVEVGTQAVARGRGQRKVPIELLHPNPRNPRKSFSEAELEEFASSVSKRGIIQPIAVRSRGDDHYEIIAGERRWRAAQRAGLHEVPIVLLDVSDAEALEIAIIENVQRADLNPIEEATGYQTLMDQFGHSQDDVAKTVGKATSPTRSGCSSSPTRSRPMCGPAS
jgi:ParB family chromosome partitioning protein